MNTVLYTFEIRALRKALALVWKDFELIPCRVDSVVSGMPKSDHEDIRVAMNRAKNVLKSVYVDSGICVGGMVNSDEYGMFAKS